jgi:hypothetical protein
MHFIIMDLYSDFCFTGPGDLLGRVWRVVKIFSWRAQVTEQEVNHQTLKGKLFGAVSRSLPFSRQVKGLHLEGIPVILTPAGCTVWCQKWTSLTIVIGEFSHRNNTTALYLHHNLNFGKYIFLGNHKIARTKSKHRIRHVETAAIDSCSQS